MNVFVFPYRAAALKRRIYGNRVITIAWSTFNSNPHRTRCCVLG